MATGPYAATIKTIPILPNITMNPVGVIEAQIVCAQNTIEKKEWVRDVIFEKMASKNASTCCPTKRSITDPVENIFKIITCMF